MRFNSAAARKPADMPISRAILRAQVVEGENGNSEIVMSTANIARDGHILEPQGCELLNYLKNPVMLWQHDPEHPVANAENIRVSAQDIRATVIWPPEGTTEIGDETRRLVKANVVRAVSVSFDPIEYEPLDPKKPRGGQRILRWELLECSFVSVPADVGAIITQRALREGKILGQKNARLLLQAHRDIGTARRAAANARSILQRLTPAQLDESSSTVQVSEGLEDERALSREGAAINAKNAALIEAAADTADDCHDAAVRCRGHLRKVLSAAGVPLEDDPEGQEGAKDQEAVEEQDRDRRHRQAEYFSLAVRGVDDPPLTAAEDADRRRRQAEFDALAGRQNDELALTRRKRLADLARFEARTATLPERRKLRTSWKLH